MRETHTDTRRERERHYQMHFRQHVAQWNGSALERGCLDLFSIHHQIASPAPKPISTVEFPGQRNHLKVKVRMEHPWSAITWKQCMTKRFIYLVNVTTLKSAVAARLDVIFFFFFEKCCSAQKLCWFRG